MAGDTRWGNFRWYHGEGVCGHEAEGKTVSFVRKTHINVINFDVVASNWRADLVQATKLCWLRFRLNSKRPAALLQVSAGLAWGRWLGLSSLYLILE